MNSCNSTWQAPVNTPEKELWIAVINTALEDALASQDSELKEKARQWFRRGGQDFRLACDLADLDAGSVQKRVIAVIGGRSVQKTRH